MTRTRLTRSWLLALLILTIGAGCAALPDPPTLAPIVIHTATPQGPKPAEPNGQAPATAAEIGLAVGNRAPEFSTTLLSGSIQSLVGLRGKVVLVNFWATWCGPCRNEMPYFQTLADTYAGRGFVVLAVNNREGADKIAPFLDDIKVHFPVGLDQSGKINTQYEVRQYPTTFVIDRQGVILARQFGPFPEGAVQAALESWLK